MELKVRRESRAQDKFRAVAEREGKKKKKKPGQGTKRQRLKLKLCFMIFLTFTKSHKPQFYLKTNLFQMVIPKMNDILNIECFVI